MIVELIVLLVVLFVTLSIVHLKKQKYTKEGIPIIGNIPWLGCGIQLGKEGPYFLKKMNEKYGDVFQIRAGGKQMTFCLNETFLKRFYLAPEHEVSFYKGLFSDDSPFGLNIIIGNPTQKHLTTEEINEAPNIKIIKKFITDEQDLINELPNEFETALGMALGKDMELLKQGKTIEIDAFEIITKMITVLTSKLMLGERVAHNPAFLEHCFVHQKSSVAVCSLPHMFAKKHIQIVTTARRAAIEIIQDSIDRGDDTVAHQLSLASYSSGRSYRPEAALTAHSLVFATLANTNAATTNCLIEILTNQDVKRKVLAEIEEIAPVANIPFENISKLEYLNGCISETVRIYAPPIHLRKSVVDMKDDNDRIIIPKNEFICVSPFLRYLTILPI